MPAPEASVETTANPFGENFLTKFVAQTQDIMNKIFSGNSAEVFKSFKLDGVDILIGVAVVLAILLFGVYQYLVFRKKTLIKARTGKLYVIEPGLEAEYKGLEKKVRMQRLLESFVGHPPTFFDRLTSVEPCVSFEVHGNGKKGYATYIWVTNEEADHLPAKMRSYYVHPIEVPEDPDPENKVDGDPAKMLLQAVGGEDGYSKSEQFYTAEYQLAGEEYLPIREWTPGTQDPLDPMEQMFSIMDSIVDNHVAGFTVTIKDADKAWQKAGLEYLRGLEYEMPQEQGMIGKTVSFWKQGGAIEAAKAKQGQARKRQASVLEKTQIDLIANRLKQEAFSTVIRIYSSDKAIFELLCKAFEMRYKGELNTLVKVSDRVSLQDMFNRWFDKTNMILGIGEIASVYHFADSLTNARRLKRGGSSTAAADDGVGVLEDEGRYNPFGAL